MANKVIKKDRKGREYWENEDGSYEDEKGKFVFRTIGGRPVRIHTGESLSKAMKESGDFNMRKDIADNVKFKDMKETSIKRKGVTAEEYQKAENKAHILREQYEILKREMDMEQSGTQDYRDVRDDADDKYWEMREAQDKYDELMKKDGYMERKYKMPSNSKKEKEDFEYDLYKRAKENPDSIDPMTENSTDWEALDRKYSNRYDYEKEMEEFGSKEMPSNIRLKQGDLTDNDKATLQAMKKEFLSDEEIVQRVKENKIVDSFGNNVVYQNSKGNWITSRDSYNDYVNGKKDRLGGELVLNEKQARETLASYEALDKYPYEGYARDMKTGNDKKYEQRKQENLDKMYKTIGYDDSKYNYGYKRDRYDIKVSGEDTDTIINDFEDNVVSRYDNTMTQDEKKKEIDDYVDRYKRMGEPMKNVSAEDVKDVLYDNYKIKGRFEDYESKRPKEEYKFDYKNGNTRVGRNASKYTSEAYTGDTSDLKAKHTKEGIASYKKEANDKIRAIIAGKSRADKGLEKYGLRVERDNSAQKQFGKRYFGKNVEVIDDRTGKKIYSSYDNYWDSDDVVNAKHTSDTKGTQWHTIKSGKYNRENRKDVRDKFNYYDYLKKPYNEAKSQGDTLGQKVAQYKQDKQYLKQHEHEIKTATKTADRYLRTKNELDNYNLKKQYQGTYEYLKNTTNMSGEEILEYLKKIKK